jgi:hypothetical protein
MPEQAISRVLFPPRGARDNDHSSSPGVATGIERPTRELGRTTLGAPLFGLAPGGVCLAPAVTGGTGELLPRRFTLTPAAGPPGRFVFCGTFLPVTRTGRYPAPCPMEPGLSSPLLRARQRSSVMLRHATKNGTRHTVQNKKSKNCSRRNESVRCSAFSKKQFTMHCPSVLCRSQGTIKNLPTEFVFIV